MGGSAILGTNLVDSLVPDVVDGLRDDLHPAFGVRQFRVYTVRRTWSGGITGDGSYSDVETELTPQPLVKPYRTEYRLDRCGIDEAGLVVLREISLTYTEAELVGGPIAAGEEWLIKLIDAHGQSIADRYWVVARPPFPDRIKDIGWIVQLEKAVG